MRKITSALLTVLVCLCAFTVSPEAYAAENVYGAGRVTTASTALNVRSSAASNASVKTKLARNSYVTLISKSGNYWRVKYSASGYGYCHSDYITTVSSAVSTVKTSSSRLRVRSSASSSASVKGYLASGTSVCVLATSGEFSKIVYNGTETGYVSSAYLTASSGAVYKTVKLSVPDFKQTDSRWSWVTLGSSGQTIEKIGCATTAIAMLESYRTGTVIYPDAMSKKLSYTSGGAVYWPSDYTVITSSSGYLTKIYTLLSNGKPVLLGAKKSNGSQHYVVVTGVAQTNTLSASDFYINDPGSKKRTTLDSFLDVYPNFYKMMHY